MLIPATYLVYLQEPIVGCAPGLKLQGTQRVSDVLQGIHQAMGVVIAGVDAPGVTAMRMLRKLDSVGYEVPHHSYIILMVTPHSACQAGRYMSIQLPATSAMPKSSVP